MGDNNNNNNNYFNNNFSNNEVTDPSNLMKAILEKNTAEVVRLLGLPEDHPDAPDVNKVFDTNISPDDKKITPLLLAILLDHKEVIPAFMAHPRIDVNLAPDVTTGTTPLMGAALSPHHEILVELLKHPHIRVNGKDVNGQTAVHMAVAGLFNRTSDTNIQALLNAPKIKRNVQDIEGNTPLHLAVRLGLNSKIRLLLQKRVNRYVKNNAGKIPYDYVSAAIDPVYRRVLKPQLTEWDQMMENVGPAPSSGFPTISFNDPRFADPLPETALDVSDPTETVALTNPVYAFLVLDGNAYALDADALRGFPEGMTRYNKDSKLLTYLRLPEGAICMRQEEARTLKVGIIYRLTKTNESSRNAVPIYKVEIDRHVLSPLASTGQSVPTNGDLLGPSDPFEGLGGLRSRRSSRRRRTVRRQRSNRATRSRR